MSAPKCKLCGKPHWLNEPHAGVVATRGNASLVPVSRLAELEAVIERGVTAAQALLEAGHALAEIRRAGLYRAEYGTFEMYCRVRWGWTDRRARQLVAAAAMWNRNQVPVVSERQSRALAPLRSDPETAKKVLAEVEATGGRVTAKALGDAVRRHLQPQLEVTTEEPYRPRLVTCPDCGHRHECAGSEV